MSSYAGSDIDSQVDSLGFLSQDNAETSLYGESSAEAVSNPPQAAAADDERCAEGTLLLRKGRSTGHASWLWKTCFVNCTFKQGGSISVYRENPGDDNSSTVSTYRSKTLLRNVYSRIKKVSSITIRSHAAPEADKDLFLYVPSHLPWVAKDVEHSQATFCIEIPTADESYDPCDSSEVVSDTNNAHDNMSDLPGIDEDEVPDNLFDDMITARKKGRPMRVYFRCPKGSAEKAFWIQAFTHIGRFSNEMREKKSLLVTLASPLYSGRSRVRTRDRVGAALAKATRQLEGKGTSMNKATNDLANASGGVQGEETKHDAKEYKVLPQYAYPHRYMTRDEMVEEMELTSAHFHDLRLPNTADKELGSLRVEVLSCVGLPKMDRTSQTDAVVYLVCGQYAFSTDVIANCANPMWLRHTRRACIFPIFHAYARLYVGVFDDDDHHPTKDDFAGRVVVNLARLRPSSTYDVTLPLRLSTHAFSRRKRGAVRLRFTLNYKNEREALLTYVPRSLNIPLPQHSKPNTDVTVACGDPKAFRNIALTVHGSHMTGRFTFPKVKAVIREMNFTRKTVINLIRQEIFDIREWKTPSVSAYVFLAWMHCIYANSFSLVPAYTVFYFVLLLMRTYAIYGIDGPNQRGFVPPSWEELFGALLLGGFVRPLTVEERLSQNSQDSLDSENAVDYRISTHRPRFKRLLHFLGFIPEYGDEIELDEHHLEFPFADGKIYPKFRVRECRADVKEDSDAISNHFKGAESLRMTRDKNGEIRLIPRFDDILRKDSNGLRDYDEEERNFATREAFRHTRKTATQGIVKTAHTVGEIPGISHVATGIGHVVSPIKTGMGNVGHMLERQSAHIRSHPVGYESDTASSTAQSDQPHADHHGGMVTSNGTRLQKTDSKDHSEHSLETDASPTSLASKVSSGDQTAWPDQDLEQNGPSTDKKLTDDLNESKDKMHELTWHLFDDKVYKLDSDGRGLYFGDAKKPEKRRKNLPKHLNKLLEVEQYSHSNPFVARLGLYVEPIVESSLSFLCMFRAIFNATTWQDPMLTFWLSIFLFLASVILFIFPWRLFLFVVGLLLVGPQNYVIRKLRAKYNWPPRRRATRREKKSETEPGPVAYRHVGLHGILGPRPRVEADPREIQHVVVPYGPLMYQRFYDWPPEPQYAKVYQEDPDLLIPKPSHMRLKSTSFGSTGNGNQPWRNGRRRVHRRATSLDSDGLRSMRPRLNTGDWQPLPPLPTQNKKDD